MNNANAVTIISQVPALDPDQGNDLDSSVISIATQGLFEKRPQDLISAKPLHQQPSTDLRLPELFRLFVKKGEYVYARANDIIMVESCDHLVKVYLGIGDKAKLTLRHNTLKDFLLLLPQTQFVRIGRFCVVNIQRLSGGNCNKQVFEFDFKISVELKHSVSHSVFSAIGK